MRNLVCGLVLVTCFFSQSATGQEGEGKGEVGLVLPLSGPYGPVGRQVREVAEFAARNAHLELRVVDSKGTPKGALAAMVTLSKDPNVWTIIGPLGRHESLAAAGIAERLAISLFVLNGAESLNRVGDWIFRPRPSPEEQVEQLVVAIAKRGLTRIAILYPDNTYGQSSARAFADRAQKRGVTITAISAYDEKTTQFDKPLQVLIGERARVGSNRLIAGKRADGRGYLRVRKEGTVDFEALFVPDMHGRVARMLPFLSGVGIQDGRGGDGVAVQLLGLAGWQGASMELTGALAAGAIYVDPFAPEATGGRAEEFHYRFLEEFGRSPVDLEAQVFDVVHFIGKSFESLGSNRRKDFSQTPRNFLRRSFLRQRSDGVCGTLSFGPKGEPVVEWGLYRFADDGTVTSAGDH